MADSQRSRTSRRAFLKSSAALAGAASFPNLLLGAESATSKPLMAYVGTFSAPLKDMLPTQVDLPPGNGQGIHIFQVDRKTGELKAAGIHRMGVSPSRLEVNSAGTRMYSANETDSVGETHDGSVSAFAINREDGSLTELNRVSSRGKGPTYVSLHPSGKFLLVANYFGGSVSVLPVKEDGSLGPATDVHVDKGEIGPTTATNAPPGSFAFSGHDRTHAHMIQSDPMGNYVYHVDLGMDQILAWKWDASGRLIPHEQHVIAFPPGDGPRHFHFHPDGQTLYSIQEEGSTVVVFDFSPKTGKLTERQTISTLPPGIAGSNFCSEIQVSQDGRFVYAGNRLHDSIAIFAVGEQGTLNYIGEEWTRGNYPRSFSFDPTGRFLYCCNQRADCVAVFDVDQKRGLLKFSGHYAAVGNPSHLTFVDLT